MEHHSVSTFNGQYWYRRWPRASVFSVTGRSCGKLELATFEFVMKALGANMWIEWMCACT